MSEKSKKIRIRHTPKRNERLDTWEDLSTTIATDLEGRPESPRHRIVPSSPPLSPAKSRVKGTRLLIVDGDPIRVDALAMDLRNLDAIVAVGDQSTNGYAQAAKFLPDAIVSDLVRPGETGFRFIQTLRRHPLLRWSSVILSRWWQETGEGEGQVMLDQVLDQLEELLAPIRVIEERIAAGRPLGDRVEMTGPAALLRLLANAGLTGTLFVNDGWNNFSLNLSNGRIVCAYRKGIDGKADDGLDAILQLMLADTGKWSFERQRRDRDEEGLDAEETLARANRIVSRIFGQRLKPDPNLTEHIVVRPHFLRTATETVSPSAIEIARHVADGADLNRFRKFFVDKDDLTEVERITHTLFRCGAIRYVETPIATGRVQKNEDAAASVVNLLNALHDNPFAPKAPKNKGAKGGAPRLPAGAYHLQDVAPERIAVTKHRPVRLTLAETPVPPAVKPDPSTIPSPDFLSESGALKDTEVAAPLGRSRRVGRSGGGGRAGTGRAGAGDSGAALDSTANGPATPAPETKDLRHMWVAIALALLLGIALVIGIVLISSVDRDREPARSEPVDDWATP